MTITLRIFLVIAAFLVLLFIKNKIKSSKLEVSDSIFWLVFAFLLLINAIFPQLASWAAHHCGVDSTSNFVFLCVIGILVIKCFSLTVNLSIQKARLTKLIEHVALLEKDLSEKSQL